MDLQGFNSGISNTAFSITLDSIQEVRKLRIMNEELNMYLVNFISWFLPPYSSGVKVVHAISSTIYIISKD